MRTPIVLRYLLVFYILASSCQTNSTKPNRSHKADTVKFPLAEFQQITPSSATVFAPTLSAKIEGRNVIYCPTLVLAWQSLIKHKQIELAKDNPLFVLNEALPDSSLFDDEYLSSSQIKDNRISISTQFAKSLFFKVPLDTSVIEFENSRVKAFGLRFYQELLIDEIKILSYKDDDHFIVSLLPTNTDDEIVLAKGIGMNLTLPTISDTINWLIGDAKQDSKIESNTWKYSFRDDDKLLIPVLSFNYEMSYQNMIGQQLKINGKDYITQIVKQRIGCVLNETGARVESEAEIVCVAAATPPAPGEVKPHPKNMIMNKPFVLMMRKKGYHHPYLMALVNNTDFMIKR